MPPRVDGHIFDVPPYIAAAAGSNQPLRESIGFFGRFLRNPTQIGAVLPSSRYLSRALVGRLDLAPGQAVVEFGPGTGPATAVLHELLPKGVHYLGIELDEGFHGLLTRRFPTLQFVNGSAADLRAILADRGLPAPSRIVSGLPFASLPPKAHDDIVSAVVWALRQTGGEFRTFQYVHAYGMRTARRFRAMMQERFAGFERIGPTIRNVPPAFVLRYWDAK